MFEDFDSLEGVFFDGDEVGVVAGGEDAYIGGAADEVGGVAGGGLDGLGWRHAVHDHVVELLGVVAVGVDSGVGAEGHFDSGLEGFAEVLALRFADHGYILENGRVVMDGDSKSLRENEDVKEFYLGMGGSDRKSFRDVKSYKRRKRWLA